MYFTFESGVIAVWMSPELFCVLKKAHLILWFLSIQRQKQYVINLFHIPLSKVQNNTLCAFYQATCYPICKGKGKKKNTQTSSLITVKCFCWVKMSSSVSPYLCFLLFLLSFSVCKQNHKHNNLTFLKTIIYLLH